MIFKYKEIYKDILVHKCNITLLMNTDFVIQIWNERLIYNTCLKIKN